MIIRVSKTLTEDFIKAEFSSNWFSPMITFLASATKSRRSRFFSLRSGACQRAASEKEEENDVELELLLAFPSLPKGSSEVGDTISAKREWN